MCTQTERATWLIQEVLAPIHHLAEYRGTTTEDGKLQFMGYPVANLSSIIIGAANVFFIHEFQMKMMYQVQPFDKKEIEKHADIVIELLSAKFDL